MAFSDWFGSPSYSSTSLVNDPALTDTLLAASPTATGGQIGYSNAGAAATPTDWAKIAGALGKLGGTAGGGGTDDSRYLRIQAQAAPFEPGSQGLATLLATLMQMHQAAALARQPPLQPVRASLLG